MAIISCHTPDSLAVRGNSHKRAVGAARACRTIAEPLCGQRSGENRFGSPADFLAGCVRARSETEPGRPAFQPGCPLRAGRTLETAQLAAPESEFLHVHQRFAGEPRGIWIQFQIYAVYDSLDRGAVRLLRHAR